MNVEDDYSKELAEQLLSFSISGTQVTRFLNLLIAQGSDLYQITWDNCTEFNSNAMFFWEMESGNKLVFIQPGKATQSAFVECLNGRFRRECLDHLCFRRLDETTQINDA